jgi:Protein of unknown function (DUF1800)
MARRSTSSSFIRRNLLRVAPRPPALPPLALLSLSLLNTDENRAPGALIAAIGGGTAGSTITLIDDAGGRVAKTGINIVAGLVNIDFEATPTVTLKLRQAKTGFATLDQRFTLTVNDLNENILTPAQIARFLGHAGLGATPGEMAAVDAQGFAPWLDAQLAMPRPFSWLQWMLDNAAATGAGATSDRGFDEMINSTMASATDVVRHNVALALLNYIAVGLPQVSPIWPGHGMTAFIDIIWNDALGNYRNILANISRSAAMGFALSFIGSKKANLATGSRPDENFAREIMQLFTMGLFKLNLDGTKVLDGQGKPIDSFSESDVQELSRVYTGWINANSGDPGQMTTFTNPTLAVPGDHDLGAKTILGQTIPAYSTGTIEDYMLSSLSQAIDIIFNQQNTAAYVATQMIQNLVTYNPTPAYVGRVAAKFVNNGVGVRGDMKAVVKAVLLDSEARNDAAALASNSFGRHREPARRVIQFTRLFPVTVNRLPGWVFQAPQMAGLGQYIGRSVSIFGFFQTGYAPPGTPILAQGLKAPALRIVNEQTVNNLINFFQVWMEAGSVNYNSEVPPGSGNYATASFDVSPAIAADTSTDALLAWLNLHLAANQIDAATIALIKTEVDAVVPVAPTNNLAKQRAFTAILLMIASPNYLGVR